MQSQNQRSIRGSPPSELEQENEKNSHLFMQEDEMAAWLHYPLDEDNFCAQLELLDNNMNMSSQTHTNNPMVRSSHVTTEPGMTEPPSRPPILPSRRSE
nr:isoform 2 of transcription factor pif1 [Quercus suber]